MTSTLTINVDMARREHGRHCTSPSVFSVGDIEPAYCYAMVGSLNHVDDANNIRANCGGGENGRWRQRRAMPTMSTDAMHIVVDVRDHRRRVSHVAGR